MRYILKDTGYIEEISFTHEIECNNKTCIEYTGSVPSGYESLAEWCDNANINAYKIVDGNLTYDSEEDNRLQSLWASQQMQSSDGITLNLIYPIGSYYETSDLKFNPNIYWGGVWELEEDGTVLVSKSSVTSSKFNVDLGTVLGEEEHKLTIEEMPSHNHGDVATYFGNGYHSKTFNWLQTSSGNMLEYVGIPSEGGNNPHTNIQPSKVVNRWHRIA